MEKLYVETVMRNSDNRSSTIGVFFIDSKKAKQKLETLMQIDDALRDLRKKHGNDVDSKAYRQEHLRIIEPLLNRYLDIDGRQEIYAVKGTKFVKGQILDKVPEGAVVLNV